MHFESWIDLPDAPRVMKEEEGHEQLSAAEAYEARWAYLLNILKAVISIVQVKLQHHPSPRLSCITGDNVQLREDWQLLTEQSRCKILYDIK